MGLNIKRRVSALPGIFMDKTEIFMNKTERVMILQGKPLLPFLTYLNGWFVAPRKKIKFQLLFF